MKSLIQSVLILMAVLMSTRGAEEVYTQVGETINLKPPAIPGLQTYYVFWFFGEVELAWRNPYGGDKITAAGKTPWNNSLSMSDDYSLTIKNIQQKHFGTFVCKVNSNAANIKITSIHLLKLSVNMNPPSPLLPGEPLSLVCNADTPPSKKKPQIRWLNPQKKKMENNQGQVTVRATSQHYGEWTCVVTNNGKEYEARIFVTVVDLSPAPSRPQYTSESSPLTVPCSIPADISWEQIKAKGIQGVHWHFFPKPGSTLTSDDPQRLFFLSLEDPMTWKADQGRGLIPVLDPKKKKNLSLTRRQGREEDKGDYVCTLEFKNGVTLNRTVHVEVLQIIPSPGKDLISGQQLNLTCSPGHPLPSDLRLKWFPPERSSLPSLTPDRHPAYLTIPEVGTGDGGKWRCELQQNSTLLTSAVITLKIEPKLSVWMLVIICSVTVIVILLLILVFILYRRRQRKVRHLRHRLCQCKNPKPKGFYRT